MAIGAHLEPVIDNLVGMGFERDQAILALRAAFFNPERAIEYLIGGIPPHLLQQAQQQAANPQAPAQQGVPAPQPGAQVGGAGGMEGIDEATMVELEALVTNPTFRQIREQVRQNPQILGGLLQYLQQASPNLYNVSPISYIFLQNSSSQLDQKFFRL